MLLELQVPRMSDQVHDVSVEHVFVEAGARVDRGTRLVELRADLGSVAAQNCSPVIDFRLVANEAGWVRRVDVARGDAAAVGAAIVIVSSAPDEPLDVPATRALRVNVGVVPFAV